MPMTSPANYIFDIDGTIADLHDGYAEMFSTVFARFNMAYDPSKVQEYADSPLEDLFSKYNTGCTCKFRDFITLAISSYERCVIGKAGAFPDSEVIKNLGAEGCRFGIVSRSYEEHIRKIVSAIGMDGVFTSVVGTERSFIRRPDPYALNLCISEMGVPKESVCLVSARPLDIETGRNAGIRTVLLDRKGGKHPDSCAELVISSLSEIL